MDNINLSSSLLLINTSLFIYIAYMIINQLTKKVIVKYIYDPFSEQIVEYAKEGDACIDIKATSIISETDTQITYGTSMFVEIPLGYEMEIRPRSSICKYSLSLANSPATIDSGYRGEIKLVFNKLSPNGIYYKVSDKIAQFKINSVIPIIMIPVTKLTPSERGEGGFGHTGN